ncbi:MAG: tetratricopeptide repeat protein, partial [Pseudomonadota bacterium]
LGPLRPPFRIRPVWLEVALPMARGLAGFARGDHHTAYRHMAPAIDRLTEIGGSHAQRDLFTQAWIRTLMETGRHQEALALTASRAEAYPAVAETGRQMREALSRMHGAA